MCISWYIVHISIKLFKSVSFLSFHSPAVDLQESHCQLILLNKYCKMLTKLLMGQQKDCFLKLFIYLFWLRRIFAALQGLSLVVVSGGYSLVAVCGLLIVVASLVAGHML